MSIDKEHRISVSIADIDTFSLPIQPSEEMLYRQVIENINRHVDRFRFGPNADKVSVAMAKVAIYYATMLYRRNDMMNTQAQLLAELESKFDSLLEQTGPQQ